MEIYKLIITIFVKKSIAVISVLIILLSVTFTACSKKNVVYDENGEKVHVWGVDLDEILGVACESRTVANELI